MSGKPVDYSRWDKLDLSDSSDDEGPSAAVSKAMAAMALKANQPGSTAASSSAASPRVAGASDGDTMPFNYDEMPGYKVHRSPSAAYPSPKRCGMCLKSPPDVPSLFDCGQCGLISYCSKECQRQHWRAKHKEVCQKAKKFADLPRYRLGYKNPLKHAFGMMDDDEFYELQRRREDQIIDEVASRDVLTLSVSFRAELVDNRYLDIELICGVKDEERHATAVEAAYPSRQGFPPFIIYPSFRFVRLSMDTTTPCKDRSAESLRSLYACIVSVVSTTIQGFIYKILSKTGGRLPVFRPFFDFGFSLGPLFWANKAASITIAREFVFYFRPHIRVICVKAVVHACNRLFGEDIKDRMGRNEKVHVNKPHEYLCRKAWKNNIVHYMDQYQLTAHVDQLCQQHAAQSDVSFESVKELLETALQYTDIFRKHLLDYTADMAANTLGGWTLAKALAVTEERVQAVREELEALNPQYWPLHKAIREVLSQPPPKYHAPCDGRLLTLDDSRQVSELEVMLKTQGLIKLAQGWHRQRGDGDNFSVA
ncbi:unnamed protein product [Vitrella brassicaformis CCMP3155]|uniref:MYND-type domain-containing protein n=1 Tax=Vitrella brassicaformis (strain CCMP3155) TaxID=1169540 RepID=A0A0G4FPU6_VITBC|nr:unnamed protein product [Vitrella brassicaformis CCMP3155]|eukprot:CEM16464.1 unnamed protein product [Vitrella brassicaformis CCMP3155]